MTKKTSNVLVVLKPKEYLGRLATKNGEPFRYPSQNFYVKPVMFKNGSTALVTSVVEVQLPLTAAMADTLASQVSMWGITRSEFMDSINASSPQEAADYINGFLEDKIILNLDPTIAYDYQALLVQGRCPTCGQEMKWRIAPHVTNQDDKFCQADCCGMRYSMVPERVRVIAVPQATEDKEESFNQDFMKELETL